MNAMIEKPTKARSKRQRIDRKQHRSHTNSNKMGNSERTDYVMT
jgi:hypothetical protein